MPIVDLPDPDISPDFACLEDSRELGRVTQFLEEFTAANGTRLENYAEPHGFNWGPGFPDYTPGGIWVITGNVMRETLLNFSFQRPVCQLAYPFVTGDEVYCDISSISPSNPGFTFCARSANQAYYLRIDRSNNRMTAMSIHLGLGTQTNVVHFAQAWGSGTQARRLGATILDTTTRQMEVWLEPYGGGARTIMGAWTPALDLFNNAAQGGVGMISGTGVGCTWDNITIITGDEGDVSYPDVTDYDAAYTPAVTEYEGP